MALFARHEILRTETFYLFRKRYKLVTFVPEKYNSKLLRALSKAGAGKIGNYEMCSFSTAGVGTYKPLEGSDPYSGEKGKVSMELELKFEIECGVSELNRVVDALHKAHPYEEVAYEVYEFFKRDKIRAGKITRLKHPLNIEEIISRLNRKLIPGNFDSKKCASSIVESDSSENAELEHSARMSGCELIIRGIQSGKKVELIFT